LTCAGGADVSIVTTCWLTSLADARGAGIAICAGVAVIAWGLIERVDAAEFEVTSVIGAEVVIITRRVTGRELAPARGDAHVHGATDVVIAQQGLATGTSTILALVEFGTAIAVVARGVVGLVHTTQLLIAGVVGTEVVVVAIQLAGAHALTLLTVVADSTHCGICARLVVGNILAAQLLITGIISTHVTVIARHELARTPAVAALVIVGARIAIVAGGHIQGVDASLVCFADVVGAGIPVVTVKHLRRDALAATTVVPSGTGIGIVAVGIVWFEEAAQIGGTGIVGALIAVVAGQGLAGEALTVDTGIVHSADAAVLATTLVGFMLATGINVTEVVGTDVAVVTIQRVTTGALT
jgi:hypothetical protein